MLTLHRPPAVRPASRAVAARAAADNAARAMPAWDKVYAALAARSFASTPAVDAVAAVDAGKAVIVDVRPADRAAKCTPVGAVSVPLYDKPDLFGGKAGFGTLLKAALLAANGVQPVELDPGFAAAVDAAAGGKAVYFLDEAGGSLAPTAQFPCGKASRSLQAAYKALEAGFDPARVGHVEGGLALYAAEGLPLTAPYDASDLGRTPNVVR